IQQCRKPSAHGSYHPTNGTLMNNPEIIEQNNAVLDDRIEEAKLRSEDRKLALEDRAAARREMNDLRRMQIQATRDNARLANETRLQIAEMKGVGDQRKPPPGPVEKELYKAFSTVDGGTQLYSTFKPEYAVAFFGKALNTAAKHGIGSEIRKEAEQWWSDYQARKNVVRHTLFGSALTANEKSEWERQDVDASTDPAVVQERLARRAQLEAMAYR